MKKTYTSYQTALKKGLPKQTQSICPTCKKLVPAEIYSSEGAVWIDKTCPEHGRVKDIYWSDVDLYLKVEKYAYDARTIENPQVGNATRCPDDCGLCNLHLGATNLANIDVTNRCNLRCSFCFANAYRRGYVYEPSFEQIVEMMKILRQEQPVPAPAIQFSGGEPTLRDDLAEIIKAAKDLGFLQIQLASNGVKIARDEGLIKRLSEAGLSTLYLHFDGISKATEPLLEIKKQAIVNCRKIKLGVVLVPTLLNGINDHEIGGIVRFAAENVDVIRGVNFQPVAFTGAASSEEREKRRFTIPDLCNRIEVQTNGEIKKSDFYPVPCVVAISKLVEAYTGKPQVELSAHPHCGMAIYVFVTEKGLMPINRFVDVEKLFASMDEITSELLRGSLFGKAKVFLKGLKTINECIKEKEELLGVNFKEKLKKILRDQDYSELSEFHWRALFIGTMHFMDNFNYDVERVRRCVIHYATPDPKRRIVPFCAYNSGPTYREEIERKYSVPLEEWEARYGKIKFDEGEKKSLHAF